MEFLSGMDLDQRLTSGQPLTLEDKLDIVSQLCEGLGYAHEQGIVHRDVKPGNVRVLEDKTVKILDFGIAKFAVSSMTQSGTIMGTPSYMAPEQIMGQPVDGRADLFSAGVLLYELLTGQKPFVGDAPTAVVYQIMHVEPPSLREKVPDLPDALYEVVARALMKNPNERYGRASEMASDLQMVKMMLDLPLHGGDAAASSTATPSPGKLFATVIRERTGGNDPASPVMNARMRASAAAAAADAAPRGREEAAGHKGLIYGVAAAVIVVVGLGIYMLSGRGGERAAGGGASGTPAAATSGATGGADAGAPGAVDGMVAITSRPTGAKISVNGTDTGKTTNGGVQVKLGDTVSVALEGYEPSTGKIEARDIQAGTLEFVLDRPQAATKLRISAVYPFELVSGTKVVSASSEQHEITVQPRTEIMARNRDLLLNSKIDVNFTRPMNTVTLPAPGGLNVFSSDETCKVTVNGQDLGEPPIVQKPTAPGTYTVAVKCASGNPDPKRVTVTSGQQARVTF